MSPHHVNLLGPLSRSQMDLALSLAAVAAGVTLAPDNSAASFAAVKFAERSEVPAPRSAPESCPALEPPAVAGDCCELGGTPSGPDGQS